MKYNKANVIAIVDTETTDKYWNSSAPVQIAALIMDAEGNVVDTFNERIKTTHKINPEASKVHGIYEKDLVNCRSEIAVLNDFISFIMGNKVDMILTYNGEAFDRPMLNERCKKLGIETDIFNKEKFKGVDGYYDCVFLAKKENLFGLKDALGRKWKLTLVSECLGISTEDAHDALADVTMLKEIWLKIDPLIHPENWFEDKQSITSLF